MGGNTLSIYWEGQSRHDWVRYERRKVGLTDRYLVQPLNALYFPEDHERRRWSLREHAEYCDTMGLRPLDLMNSDPIDCTPTEVPCFWAAPGETAAAAERLAIALEERDPGAWPFVVAANAKYLAPSGLVPPEERIPKDAWEKLAPVFRGLAEDCRVLAEDSIPLITFDVGYEGYAAEGLFTSPPPKPDRRAKKIPVYLDNPPPIIGLSNEPGARNEVIVDDDRLHRAAIDQLIEILSCRFRVKVLARTKGYSKQSRWVLIDGVLYWIKFVDFSGIKIEPLLFGGRAKSTEICDFLLQTVDSKPIGSADGAN